MIRNIFILLVILCLCSPAAAHSFWVLRWGFDGIRNQLGLDRGPVPKVIPKVCHPHYDPRDNRNPLNERIPPFYIQAEGF
jgi:hypothetical protein